MNGWTGGSGQGGSPYAVGPATKIRPRGAYTRPHKSRPSHKLRYGSIKVKIMYEICLLIILSAGGARLPLLRSRALGPFPPAYLTVAVMPLDRESPRTRSPVHPNTSEMNGDRCYAKYGNFIELPIFIS